MIEMQQLHHEELIDDNDPVKILTREFPSNVPIDPRLAKLSDHTRRIIDLTFGGDVDEACFQALHHINTFRNPKAWAIELHGAQRQGWKDFNRDDHI